MINDEITFNHQAKIKPYPSIKDVWLIDLEINGYLAPGILTVRKHTVIGARTTSQEEGPTSESICYMVNQAWNLQIADYISDNKSFLHLQALSTYKIRRAYK